ncbi:MAG: WD40 repeat domain-containing protein [Aquabacterium sp.]
MLTKENPHWHFSLLIFRKGAELNITRVFIGDPKEKIIWSPDGRFITLGVGHPGTDNYSYPIEFWDPGNGHLSKKLSVTSVDTGGFSPDGALFLSADRKGRFNVYDTQTWNGVGGKADEFPIDTGLVITNGQGWLDKQHFVVLGAWVGKRGERPLIQTSEGHVLDHSVVMQKIDVSGKASRATAVLFPLPTATSPPGEAPYQCEDILVVPGGKLIAALCGRGSQFIIKFFDGETLKGISTYIASPDSHTRAGEFGASFSSDGQFLFLLAHNKNDETVQSEIVSTLTGRLVGSFPSAESWGLAVSPDGHILAVGHKGNIELFNIN